MFKIPSKHVYVWDEVRGGEIPPTEVGGIGAALPQPNENLAGGAQRAMTGSAGAGGERTKIFMVVDIGGDPALNRVRKQKIYHAASPGQAAIKAFYSWWRTMRNSGSGSGSGMKVCSDGGDGPCYVNKSNYDHLMTHLSTMEERAEDKALFAKRRDDYLDAWQRINQSALDEELLVRLAVLGSKNNNKPRNYVVKYEPNLNPNWMEFWGPSKGASDSFNPIVVNAKARLVKPTDSIRGGIHYLEHDLQQMN